MVLISIDSLYFGCFHLPVFVSELQQPSVGSTLGSGAASWKYVNTGIDGFTLL